MYISTMFTRSRRSVVLGGISAFAVACCFSIGAEKDSSKKYTFRFNPPDGIEFSQTLTITKVQEMGELRKQTDVNVSKAQIAIRKKPAGYTATAKLLSTVMTRDGQAFRHPAMSVMEGLEITHELDREGRLAAVGGFDALKKRIQDKFDPQMAQMLSALLTEEAIANMANKEEAEWNGRIGNFIGRTVELGDVWTDTEEFPLPTGKTVVFHTATKFTEEKECGGSNCLRVEFFYHSKPAALEKLVGKTLGDLSKAAGAEMEAEVSGMEVAGSGERLIDPATMLIYAERIERTVKAQMDVPEHGLVTAVTKETREYEFDYGKKPKAEKGE
ncbi:MAG: hypothetical protein JSV08_07650 [Acidobacteriota bacterium]|nr:MAG: hypothetical protein JSV08_07650 [Acidobacteriota bacterium]